MLDKHYDLITQFYGDTKSKRSDVSYMNHIDEGLIILDHLGSSDATKSAYCVHPMFQVPNWLKDSIECQIYKEVDHYVLLLAMEYRNKANAYVCRERTDCFTLADMPHMVLDEVKDMLIADKVQNYKDFQLHHASHSRSVQLTRYFENWLHHLGVYDNFPSMAKLISR